MSGRHVLSKSSYIRSLQCLKSLYLYKHHYKLRDPVPPALLRRFNQGHDIGALARHLFPGGVDCKPPRPWDYRKSIARTAKLVSEAYPVIYEASFVYKGVLAVTDILVHRAGSWYAYEVKSSRKISSTYLEDAALQHLVITRSESMAGQTLGDFFILHLNRPLEQALSGRPAEIFEEHSVIRSCREMEDSVMKNLTVAFETINETKTPDIATGPQCETPYRCDFHGYCHGSTSTDS